MTMPLAEFEASLQNSGIVAVNDLVETQLGDGTRDALSLARELVSLRKITRYQAFVALKGNACDLNLGRYLILDRIGEGGMGSVYKAQHLALDRIVAVKVVEKDSPFRERFRREARLIAQLLHPNIVAVTDAGEHGDRLFLVMEHVDGQDLKDLVRRGGPFAIRDALDCVRQVATGLEYAHSRSIIHRDVKPANVLLNEEGQIKVLDFGLAKKNDLSQSNGLTASGIALGTFDYIAPEQAFAARNADSRADIYSLGCTLYFLLTGQAPFCELNDMEKIVAHRDREISDLRELRPEVTAKIEAVFRRMVAKDPTQRFGSAADLEKTIAAILKQTASDSIDFESVKAITATNSTGLKLAQIPAGEFMMGRESADGSSLNDRGYPRHDVKLSSSFWLGVHPVTQSQYARIMGDNPSGHRGVELPVTNVTWLDAIQFANHLSDIESLDRYYELEDGEAVAVGGSGYRLPTEAEWEYACRAGSDSTWHFGEAKERLLLCAWTSENSDGETHPVGRKMANRFGLHDMYGNVWEWCWDRYDELYYGYSEKVDPKGPVNGTQRVIRGGSFTHHHNCCSAARSGIDADARSQNVGFRVAKDASDDETHQQSFDTSVSS